MNERKLDLKQMGRERGYEILANTMVGTPQQILNQHVFTKQTAVTILGSAIFNEMMNLSEADINKFDKSTIQAKISEVSDQVREELNIFIQHFKDGNIEFRKAGEENDEIK